MTRRFFALLAGSAPQTKTTTPPPAPPAFFYREHEGIGTMPMPDGKTKAFPLTFQPTSNVLLDVFLNGIFQREGATYDYTYAAKTVTFNRAPMKGDFVTAQYWTQARVSLF